LTWSAPMLNLFVWKFLDSSKHLSKSFTENFQKTLTQITTENKENKELIIVGDINCNYLNKASGKSIKELLSLHGLI